jgi:hypothetical protein
MFQKVTHLGHKRGKLRWQPDILCNPLRIVRNHLLGSLRLRDCVIALPLAFEGDDVDAFVMELLGGEVIFLLGKNKGINLLAVLHDNPETPKDAADDQRTSSDSSHCRPDDR